MKLITMVTVLIGGGIPGVGVRPEGSPLRVWLKLHLSSVLESPHQFHHLWGPHILLLPWGHNVLSLSLRFPSLLTFWGDVYILSSASVSLDHSLSPSP